MTSIEESFWPRTIGRKVGVGTGTGFRPRALGRKVGLGTAVDLARAVGAAVGAAVDGLAAD